MKQPALEHVPASIPPEQFWDRFIKTRTPCVVEGALDNDEFKSLSSWTDLGYLRRKAGHAMLMVEPYNESMGQYGTSIKRESMSFSTYIDSLQSSDASQQRYLTTQYEGQNAQAALPPPCNALASDFPLAPSLMGRLTLQQVNLWLGKSTSEGTSSGLHHDMADNILLLLSGTKRFTLFPPSAAPHLMTHGIVDTIHDNGLICYAHAPTRADGLDARSAAQIKADALEAQVSDMKAHSECDAAALATLEQQLEDAQDDLMSLLVAQPGFEDDGDDFDEMELAQLDTQSDFEELNGQESTSSGDHLALPPDVQSPSDEEADAQDEDDHVSNGTAREAIEAPDEPASFSRIPANVLHAHLAGQPIENSEFFDALKRAGMPLQVELKPGQMLYMPASWFHEVTSSGDKLQPHMAFNYWFFPPDNSTYQEPYTDALIWERIRRDVQEEYDQAQSNTDNKGKRKRGLEEQSLPLTKEQRR